MAARRRRVLLDFGGSSAEAQRAVREVRNELRSMSRENVQARIDVNTRVIETKIDRVRRRLADLSRQDASPEVDLKVAKAYAQLDRLNARLALLRHKNISVDVDVTRGALERTASGLGSLDRGIQGVARGFASIFHQVPIVGGLFESVFSGAFSIAEKLGSAIGGLVASGIEKLGSTLGSAGSALGALGGPVGSVVGQVVSLVATLGSIGVIAGGIVIAINAIVGAVIALSGALVALVASAAAAAGGLGALAIAFGAALIPAAIVGIAVFTRFQAIMKAHQAQQQALATATQNAKLAEQQHTQALQSRRQAEEQLAQATVAARAAMAQAARDEADAELGLRNARNGVEDSRLQLALAKRDLREFLAQAGQSGHALNQLMKQFSDVHVDPARLQSLLGQVVSGSAGKVDPLDLRQKIQAVRDAQLGVANATNQVTHAEDNLSQARKKEADFATRGLKAYGPYRTALQAVARAQDRVSTAQAATERAHGKEEAALKKLTGTEQGTLSRLNELIKGFAALAKAVTDPVFRALNAVFDSLKGHAGEFRSELGNVGNAFADVVRAIGSFLTEPRTLSAFKTMASGAADLVHQLGARAFTSFLRIMREVAVTALPAVRQAAHDVADWLERIAGKPKRIHAVVDGLVTQFKAWAKFAGAVARLVINLFSAAAPAGKSLAGSLTRIVNNWADWIKQNPAKVRRFFRDSVQKAEDIVGWIKSAVTWLKDHLPAAAAKAKQAFDEMWPVIKKIADAVKFVVENPIGGGGNASGGGREARSDVDTPFKKALNPKTPRQSRVDLALSLLELEISSDMKKALIKLLRQLGETYDQAVKRGYDGPHFASGGIVPGSGRGDIVPAVLEPGEAIIKRAVVARLGRDFFARLNAGAVPALQPVAAVAGGDTHHHYHLDGVRGQRYPDGRAFLEHVNKLIRTKG